MPPTQNANQRVPNNILLPDDDFGDFGFDVSGRFSKFGYRKFRS
jgi:hypothetical protein